MSVRSAEAEFGQARSVYLPTVSAEVGAHLQNVKIEGASSHQSEPYEADIAMSWLLFDFGGRSARVDGVKAYLESDSWTYNASLNSCG